MSNEKALKDRTEFLEGQIEGLHESFSAVAEVANTVPSLKARITKLEAKAAILDKCCQKVDCLARGEVMDRERAAVTDIGETMPGATGFFRVAPDRTSPETSTLKPCPFCGEQKIFLNPPEGRNRGSINCPACLVAMPQECGQAEMIDAWNTRTSDLAQSPAVQSAIDEIRSLANGDLSASVSAIMAIRHVLATSLSSTDRTSK